MLCIYDKYSTQAELTDINCGLGILNPQTMTTYEEKNGEYSITLTYLVSDQDMMWLYLQPFNIVRNSEGQLFVIEEVEKTMSGGTSVITATGSHISTSYLGMKNVQECTVTDANCQNALNHMWARTEIGWGGTPGTGTVEYNFSWYSDIQKTASYYFDKVSPLYALLGAENSVINLYGGTIDRDNFTITINSRKKNSRDKAFRIVHGINMTELRYTMSVKDLCTGVVGQDNYQNWHGKATKEPQYSPHEIIKHINFSYSGDSNVTADTESYYNAHLAPEITYEVKFKDLRFNELYSDWMALQTFNIGDRGTIMSEILGIDVDAEIISRTIDDITGETTSIVLGSFRPNLSNASLSISRDSADGRRLKALEKTKINSMFTWEES